MSAIPDGADFSNQQSKDLKFIKRRIKFHLARDPQNGFQNQISELVTESNSSNGSHRPTQKVRKDLFDPAVVKSLTHWQKVCRIGPGLFNTGNSCFLNSTLQCLFYTPPLTQVLLSEFKISSQIVSSIQSCQLPNMNQSQERLPILKLYQRLVTEVFSPTAPKTIAPRSMCNNIKVVGKQFRVGRQEDAHEYLRKLLDCMHEEILKQNGLKTNDGKITETTFIHQIFGGNLRNELLCPKCKHSSKTYNSFLDLSLELTKGVISIDSAIQAFTQAEKLTAGNEWACEGCNTKVQARKQLTISQAPPVLVLQLKRFTNMGMHNVKINKDISFRADLELTCTGEQPSTVSYSLIGCITHYGSSVHSGHYVAFVKAPNGLWFEMDDTNVKSVSIDSVLKQRAYVLFYLRDKPAASATPAATHTPSSSSATTHSVNGIKLMIPTQPYSERTALLVNGNKPTDSARSHSAITTNGTNSKPQPFGTVNTSPTASLNSPIEAILSLPSYKDINSISANKADRINTAQVATSARSMIPKQSIDTNDFGEKLVVPIKSIKHTNSPQLPPVLSSLAQKESTSTSDSSHRIDYTAEKTEVTPLNDLSKIDTAETIRVNYDGHLRIPRLNSTFVRHSWRSKWYCLSNTKQARVLRSSMNKSKSLTDTTGKIRISEHSYQLKTLINTIASINEDKECKGNEEQMYDEKLSKLGSVKHNNTLTHAPTHIHVKPSSYAGNSVLKSNGHTQESTVESHRHKKSESCDLITPPAATALTQSYGAAEVEVKSFVTANSKSILELSRRGRELGGEGLWEGLGGDEAAKGIHSIVTKHRREDQRLQHAKRLSDWDQLLDSGKVKKVKTKDIPVDGVEINHFQALQNQFTSGEKDPTQHGRIAASHKHKRNFSRHSKPEWSGM